MKQKHKTIHLTLALLAFIMLINLGSCSHNENEEPVIPANPENHDARLIGTWSYFSQTDKEFYEKVYIFNIDGSFEEVITVGDKIHSLSSIHKGIWRTSKQGMLDLIYTYCPPTCTLRFITNESCVGTGWDELAYNVNDNCLHMFGYDYKRK